MGSFATCAANAHEADFTDEGDHLTERIERLRERLKKESVDALFLSSPSNRRYLTGFTGSTGVVVVSQETVYMITDFRYFDQVSAESPHVELVKSKNLLEDFVTLIKERKELRRIAFEAEHLTVNTYRAIEEKLPQHALTPAVGWVEDLRTVKEPSEIAAIERAVAVADRAFTYILDRLKGRTEREIALDLEFFMRNEGAERLAFQSIVASGPNGALPHAVPTDRVVAEGDFVTLDFGCVVDGYCSDMTRTVAVGKADDRQREIYDLVLEAQEAGVKAVRAGLTGKEVDAAARSIIEARGHGDHFGHGLGHGVGLDIHEAPRLAPKVESVLEPAMVTSVEPGIYLSGWGGVRIEDLVVVTQEGRRVLTQSPKSLIEV